MITKITAALAALSIGAMSMAQFHEISPMATKSFGQDKSYREGFRLPLLPMDKLSIDGWLLSDLGNKNTPPYYGLGLSGELWSNKNVAFGVSLGWSGHPETWKKWRGGEYAAGVYLSFKLY